MAMEQVHENNDSIGSMHSALSHVSAENIADIAPEVQAENNYGVAGAKNVAVADAEVATKKEHEATASETILVLNKEDDDEIEIKFKGTKFPVPIQSAALPSDFVKRENDRISGDMPYKEEEVIELISKSILNEL